MMIQWVKSWMKDEYVQMMDLEWLGQFCSKGIILASVSGLLQVFGFQISKLLQNTFLWGRESVLLESLFGDGKGIMGIQVKLSFCLVGVKDNL